MPASFDELGIKGGLIVSCQAPEGTPLHGAPYMAALAKAAEMAGAVGIRADGPLDIGAIKSKVDLPVIGIYKIRAPVYHPRFYITPTFEAAKAVAELSVEIIALHVLLEYDPDIEGLKTRIRRIKEELDVLVMADLCSMADAEFAVEQGVDILATTSARYAYPGEKIPGGPPLELIRNMSDAFDLPIIGEGHFKTPQDCAAGIKAGASAIVVGAALTAPESYMAEFITKMQDSL